MVVWRRWVFPILMVLVFGAIAAALVRLAFFAPAAESAAQPGVEMQRPIVAVEKGSVVNELALAGSIARDEDIALRAPADGKVTAVHVKPGAEVKKGQAILTLKQEEPARTVELVAPANGRISELPAIVGQTAALGEEAGKLSPASFHVLATVEPVQLYRLVDAPRTAQASITGGPAPFACKRLTIQVAEDGTTSVRCRVPEKKTVFAGLPVELNIAVGTAENVLVVPTTAVKGGSRDGLVWVERGDGSEPEERKISLGISDGERVEVRSGLEEGEQVLQFVPGSAAPEPEENCYEIAPGQMQCDGGTSW